MRGRWCKPKLLTVWLCIMLYCCWYDSINVGAWILHPHNLQLSRIRAVSLHVSPKQKGFDVEDVVEGGDRARYDKRRFNSAYEHSLSLLQSTTSNNNTNSQSNQTPEESAASSHKSNVNVPEYIQESSGIDEQALRASPFGKILFGVLDQLFPVFKEPNWFDVYDPPLSIQENLDLPYFDGYDFANSTWTVYIRHRYGVWNWLDRLGLVPQATNRVHFHDNGKTTWSDGYYGDWCINPAINFFQFEKHFGRGGGAYQAPRGMRIFQVQRWNLEPSVGRYWQRGLRSVLRNETNYWAIEGRIWGAGVSWRPAMRDQGKFLAIRDGANLTAVFGDARHTPWQRRFEHALSLPFYQAHPDQLERVEDNFDMFYRNLLGQDGR